MTDYEMIAAVQGYVSNGMADMLNTFTVMGAYLTAGYLVAHRVSLWMALFVTALFAAFSANGIILLFNIGMALQALLDHMHAEAAAGKAMLWSPIAKSTPNVMQMGYVALFVMTGAVVGSVFFFFECRARNLKAQSAPAADAAATP